MNAREIIPWMLKRSLKTRKEAAEEMGYSNVSSLNTVLRGGIKLNKAAQIADVLGFDLVFVDRRSGETGRVDYDAALVSRYSERVAEKRIEAGDDV